ncbi:MAG: GDP-mannose 4,6-dehydratase [Lachnospiraceae bacterium]
MSRILITGFSGFVSHHFLEYLYRNKISTDVYGLDLREPSFSYSEYVKVLNIRFKVINLLNIEELRELFTEFTPDYILHLASFSSVAYSWRHPAESFSNNTNIFLNLAATVSEFNSKCRILSVGSSEEYGNVFASDLPLTEESILKPVSPYAVARVSQEMLSKVYVDSYHLNIILTRSFNHIGVWQDERFVISSFINRALQLKKADLKEGTIETGDLMIVRDFVDVRDVVRAYYLLLMKGKCGDVYNICSGKGVKLKTVIDIIGELVGIKIHTRINPEYIRLNDNKEMIGSFDKIKRELGWEPQISFEQTIKEMIESMTLS